ncbi:MAG: radical SAM protein [Thermodesulfobacteriota bacterium]
MAIVPPPPTALLAAETGGWKKKWKDHLPVALLFPSDYRIGMSNLGFQLVYAMLNEIPGVVAERVFLPPSFSSPLRSLESNRPLTDFPVLFGSFSFEADFPHFLRMLDAAGIAPLAADRAGRIEAGRPLVVAGGVATFINPEPLAPFVDLFVLGEAEPVLTELLARIDQAVGAAGDRQELLADLARHLPGSYVPGLYEVAYHPDGTVAGFSALAGAPLPVRRNLVADRGISGHSVVTTPHAEFSDLYLVELGRGCSHGCRFCAAGFVYRPPRRWQAGAIIRALEEKPPAIRRVGLLGMEMVEPEDLRLVADHLLAHDCSLSFSSLRADVITPELLAVLAASDLKSAVIAPDGPSERLRRVINKRISRDEVLAAAAALAATGITSLKLYFMLGLPTETEADLLEMVSLIGEVVAAAMPEVRRRKKAMEFVVSLSAFVPKAWTPFQYHPMMEQVELNRRLGLVRKDLARMANVRLLAEKPEHAYLQAVLARGDRRLGLVLPAVAAGGNWRQAMKRAGIDPAWYACRQRRRDEIFPWEIIDHGMAKDYLWQEYGRAIAEKPTPRCRPQSCRRCGVCG